MPSKGFNEDVYKHPCPKCGAAAYQTCKSPQGGGRRPCKERGKPPDQAKRKKGKQLTLPGMEGEQTYPEVQKGGDG